ncbi:hypothetical protein CV102_10145 [Natronococcus pandeyae]|uniref:Uncharacterized protein n=1 Tax=Natronococcus pandeyae TaxID=2055836 RepID=A0A8J8TSB6_9EURY|nr:hypothetical protein [Natronococcus pandeyae]TYL38860.1 hypothetical protein CV102_10145 [Natronococcus pandeyae]
MSVIRQPGVLGRTTRQRLVGVTAAFSAATVETATVGLWFWLVVGSRSTSTALVALGVLFCGSLLRTSVFGATVGGLETVLEPRRLGAALALTTGWLVWLFLAEQIGGEVGVLAATVALGAALAVQFSLEQRVFRPWSTDREMLASIVPSVLLAAGAAVLLLSVWFVDWAIVTPPLSLGFTTLVIRIETIQLGVLVFGLFAVVAHQRRFQRVLGG